MKLKKFVAVALSAVMAVSVLSACGGSGVGSASADEELADQVSADLGDMGIDDVTVGTNAELHKNLSEIAAAATTEAEIVEKVEAAMGWQALNDVQSIVDLATGSTDSASFGTVKVVSAAELEEGLSPWEFFGIVSPNADKISALRPIDDVEKVADALTLSYDGYVTAAEGMAEVAGNPITGVTFTYNTSVAEATLNGVSYYVIAVEMVVTK